jgi:hypothetical protein
MQSVMNSVRYLFLFLLLAYSCHSFSQNRYTISGYVRDSLSRETLLGATIQTANNGRGVNTNPYGYYSITLPEGDYMLQVSFVGYFTSEKKITIKRDMELDFALLSRSSLSQEIVISKEMPM